MNFIDLNELINFNKFNKSTLVMQMLTQLIEYIQQLLGNSLTNQGKYYLMSKLSIPLNEKEEIKKR